LKNKKILLAVCILLLVSVFSLGCTPAERPVPETTPNNQNLNQNRNVTDPIPAPGDEMRNDRLDIDDRDDRLDVDDRIDSNNRINNDVEDNK